MAAGRCPICFAMRILISTRRRGKRRQIERERVED